MKMQCPLCSAALEIPDEYAGQEVTCAACNEKFFADVPEFASQATQQKPDLDHITPALFKQFITIEDSMNAIQRKIAIQVWTCVGLLLGGLILLVLFGKSIQTGNLIGIIFTLIASGFILAGIIHTIFCIQYWSVYKVACWRTTAINSGIPVVYAADPKQAPRKIDASFFN